METLSFVVIPISKNITNQYFKHCDFLFFLPLFFYVCCALKSWPVITSVWSLSALRYQEGSYRGDLICGTNYLILAEAKLLAISVTYVQVCISKGHLQAVIGTRLTELGLHTKTVFTQ